MEDASVELVLVRNLLRPEVSLDDGSVGWGNGDEETAGWRGVVVRVRLATKVAWQLGCEGHVGEVQLVLREIQALVTPEKFARYQAFRSIRHWSLQGLWQAIDLPKERNALLTGYNAGDHGLGSLQAELGWAVVERKCEVDDAGNIELAGYFTDPQGVVGVQGPFVPFLRLSSCHALASLSLNHVEEDDSEEDEPTETASTVNRAPSLAGRGVFFGRVSSVSSRGASSSSSISAYREIFRQFNEIRARTTLESSFEDSWQSLLQQQFFLRAMLPGAYLKSKNEAVKTGMARADVSSVFYTATPLEGALSKPIYWLLLFGVSLGFFGMGAVTTFVAEMFASVGGTPFLRFTALELRGGADPTMHGPGIAGLGLLLGGCPVGPTPVVLAGNVSGASVVLEADSAAAADGWFFVTGNSTPDHDPVRFQLERWSKKGWQAVGSSSWLLNDLGFVSFLCCVADGPCCVADGPESDGVEVQLLNGPYPTTEERGAMEELDMRVPWWFRIGPPLIGIFFGIACLLTSICGATGHFRAGVRVFFAAVAMSGIVISISSVHLLLVGAYWDGFYYLAGGIADCIFAIYGVWYQKRFVKALVCCGSAIMMVALMTFLGSGGDWRRLQYLYFGVSSSMIGIAIVVITFRRRVMHKSLQLVLPDRERYDAMWSHILETDPSAREAIASLSALVARIEGAVTACRPSRLSRRKWMFLSHADSGRSLQAGANIRQGARRLTVEHNDDALDQVAGEGSREAPDSPPKMPSSPSQAGDCWRLLRSVLPAHQVTDDEHSLEMDLDQLYAQAAGADYLLRAKLLQWVEKSPALLCVDALPSERPLRVRRSLVGAPDGTTAATDSNNDLQRSSEWSGKPGSQAVHEGHDERKPDSSNAKLRFVGIAELEAEENIMSHIKWARIKKIDRVLEKLIRGYQNDVSRLTDLARQSLYFHSLNDLKECLDVIANDPEIRILRIKNRFDLNFDSLISAGYRNLAANVLIVSKDSVYLGLDKHVCELQLLLTEFALLKNNNGHKRYVQFRNSRAE